jgi:hypothetical protein
MSMYADGESGPSLQTLLELHSATVDLHRYLLLDAGWTSAIKRADRLAEWDRGTLVSLHTTIDDQLATIERQADTLHRIFEQYDVWVNQTVRSALASEYLSSRQREGIRAEVGVEDDEFAARGVVLAEMLARQVPIERQEFRRRLPALQDQGSGVTGHAVCCAIAVTAILCGLAACPFTEGLGCVVAIGGFLAYGVCACENV